MNKKGEQKEMGYCSECHKKVVKDELVFNEYVENYVCKDCDEELEEEQEREVAQDQLEEDEWR